MHLGGDSAPTNTPSAEHREKSAQPNRNQNQREQVSRTGRRQRPFRGSHHRLREGPADLFYRVVKRSGRSGDRAAPCQVIPESDEPRERNQEFERRRQPQPVASPRVVLAKRQRQQRGHEGHQRRLPQVITERWCECLPQRRESIRDHRESSFLCKRRSIFSASFTSASVSLPDSMRWAMTGCVRPPNRPSRSSISLRWAALRETAASKM